ncbi:hypothetical protein [Desulfopila aestuarii]|uniref:Glycine cleavage system regulatory protein n=1 Tax=Desulfopila aestuarii DSM 18488 TaxID=1121416 RepID=A0A1M7Y8B5_9BACT|nr:hypothetical protein [Desulfopila aestuarii]SHO48768.1 Glycine cleavage system regulatory protein [Desulfopila aestuarii DSM 18488]
MRNSLVVTVSGADTPAAKESLLNAIRLMGGELLVHRGIRLGGQMSLIIKFQLAGKDPLAIEASLAENFPEKTFRCTEVENDTVETSLSKIIQLDVKCRNRTDPEGDLQTILQDLDCETKDLECTRYPVIGLGETVFSARCTVEVPSHCSSQAVANEVEMMMEGARVLVV